MKIIKLCLNWTFVLPKPSICSPYFFKLWSINDYLQVVCSETTLVNCNYKPLLLLKNHWPTNLPARSSNTEPSFQQELAVKKTPCDQQALTFTQAHCNITQKVIFQGFFFFGLCPESASTKEFQYHNSLFICVPASKITDKKKKYT